MNTENAPAKDNDLHRDFQTKANWEPRLDWAKNVILELGDKARAFFHNREKLIREEKGLQDAVSNADRTLESDFRKALAKAFPKDEVFGEEDGGRMSDDLWIIDPIDGTANFLKGISYFCISLAFVHKGVPVIGLIYDPMEDKLYTTIKRNGAFCNDKPIHVSLCKDPKQAVISAGFSYRRPVDAYMSVVNGLLDAGCEFRRFGAGALCMAHVAEGILDGYFELHINSWDVTAGLLLVQEAGGVTNDYCKGPWILEGNPILACPPALQAFLVQHTGIEA